MSGRSDKPAARPLAMLMSVIAAARRSSLGIIVVLFVLVSIWSSYLGLLALLEQGQHGALTWGVRLGALVIVAVIVASGYIALQTAIRGSGSTRFLAMVFALVVTVFSVGFSYVYFWDLLERRGAAEARADEAVAQASAFLTNVANQADGAVLALSVAADAAEDTAAREDQIGGSCGVESGMGRGPLQRARVETAVQLQVALRQISDLRDDLNQTRQDIRRSDLSPSERARASRTAVARAVAAGARAGIIETQLSELASQLSIEPGQPGFYCHDPALARATRAALTPLQNITLRSPPNLDFAGEAPSGPDALRRLIQAALGRANAGETPAIRQGDLIALIAAIAIDVGLLMLTLVRATPAPAFIARARAGLTQSMARYESKAILNLLTDYTVVVDGRTYVVVPPVTDTARERAVEIGALLNLMRLLAAEGQARAVDTRSGLSVATQLVSDWIFGATGLAVTSNARIKRSLQRDGRFVGALADTVIFEVKSQALIDATFRLEREPEAVPESGVVADAREPVTSQANADGGAVDDEGEARRGGVDIFLSYKREERGIADVFAAALTDEGFSAWWDPRLKPGEAFDDIITRNLMAARCVLVLWSPLSIESGWVKNEAHVGHERKVLIPVMIGACALPMPYKLLQAGDLIGWSGDREDPRWRDLVDAIGELIINGRRTLGVAETHVAPPSTIEDTPSRPAPISLASARAGENRARGEDNFWNSMRDSSDPDEFDAYLQVFPDGLYASLAQLRRAKLRRRDESEVS